jgi:UDP-glucose 6-dehydrogenase
MIHFIGTSFAARHLKDAAIARGIQTTELLEDASLIFVSEDTPTNEKGERDLDLIRQLLLFANGRPIVLTSQVPVGFTRSLGNDNIYHQAETLRIKDAEERALNPEQIIVGHCGKPHAVPTEYMNYLNAFRCPVHWMSWEEAEFSKIAINLTLISQVENTNKLNAYAQKHGLRWDKIQDVLMTDKRIGKESYLTPGRWQDSKHLMRDWVTFESS